MFNSTLNRTDFLSLRYAAPPTGNLRFQAPAPPLNMSSQGIQLANTQPNQCFQSGNGASASNPFRGNQTTNLSSPSSLTAKLTKRQSSQTEDCLFLNVFVSGEVNAQAKMPVVFWIHGGGYIAGGANGFPGGDLITEAGGGIVVVVIQYRLGVFGFLSGAEVKKNGALNAGLLDQQAALKWVQENIHLFGGDPEKVTIWGESAGAGSVLQHMVAHGGNTQPPLFRNAITSSTFLPSQYNFDDAIPEQLYSEFVQGTGCTNATNTFQCLVGVDVDALEKVNDDINKSGFSGTFVTVPVIDGDLIIERPIETIIKGKLNAKQYLGMTNTFEGRDFINSGILSGMNITNYVTQLFPQFNDNQIQDTVAQYTGAGLDTAFDQAVAIMGESIFICPTYALLSAYPGQAHKGLFAIQPGNHANDISYYFPGTNGPPFKNAQFSASFDGGFLGLAKADDPNTRVVDNIITPNWVPFGGIGGDQGHTEMLFNKTEDSQPDIRSFTTDSSLLTRCEFWMSVAASLPQ
ncbi:alpha beta-hydrolase [Pyrrhoderma noxium]|uniref:Carboxylic ester hydrolase n=1 Tax=Pyrrhoderma noxium TaxID=2282107 RepID=A0A286UEI7_9AGAM|nr:alpha beta-hydrolase [Pyrrhoderma noxium]